MGGIREGDELIPEIIDVYFMLFVCRYTVRAKRQHTEGLHHGLQCAFSSETEQVIGIGPASYSRIDALHHPSDVRLHHDN